MPVTGHIRGIVIERLAPGLLESRRRGANASSLNQLLRAIAGAQETGAPGSISRAKTDDAYNLAVTIERGATAIPLLHVATHLNNLRAGIGRFNRTNQHLIDRRTQQIGSGRASNVAIAGKADNR